jgi:hypothetical protein
MYITKMHFFKKYFCIKLIRFYPAPERDDVLVSQQGQGTWAPAVFL